MEIPVSTDFNFMTQKGLKPNSVVYIDTESFYNENIKKRLIEKKKLTGQAIADNVYDMNNNNACKSIKKLKDDGILELYFPEKNKKAKFYVVNDRPNKTYVRLPIDFVRELISRRNSETVMVYLFLYRRFEYCRKMFKPPYFSCGDIIEKVFGYEWKGGQIYKRVQTMIAELKADGLIQYEIKKVGKTYLRCLTQVNTRFVATEKILEEESKYEINEGITNLNLLEDDEIIYNPKCGYGLAWGKWRDKLVEYYLMKHSMPKKGDGNLDGFEVDEEARDEMFVQVYAQCQLQACKELNM